MPIEYQASAVGILLPREKPTLNVSIETDSMETSDDRANRSSTGSLMLPPNPNLYTTLIKSNAVMTEIVDQFGGKLLGIKPNSEIMKLDWLDRQTELTAKLRSMVETSSTEEGMITIRVTGQSPQACADVANALFEECQRMSQKIEGALVLQQADYLDEALALAQERLSETERELQEFTARNRIVDPEQRASSYLRSVSNLQSRLNILRSEEEALSLTYTDRSPEIQKIRKTIHVVNSQIESTRENLGSVGEIGFGRLIVEYNNLKERARQERDFSATLSTRADIFRVRAEQPAGSLAIIRKAQVPKMRVGPSKTKELGMALALSVVLGILWSIGVRQFKQARKNEYVRTRMDELWEEVIRIKLPRKEELLHHLSRFRQRWAR
ncbi:MAG: hypothetical protein AAF191_14070 [Verrucomicrobiota bacterium]